MRIFVIGGAPENISKSAELMTFAFEIGKRLAQKKVELIICSPYPDAIDGKILEGIKSAPGTKISIHLYYPKDAKVEEAWSTLLKDIPIDVQVSRFRQEAAGVNTPEARKFAWLFCQIQALGQADYAIVIGGKISGSSNLLVKIADSQNKEVVPLPCFGGAAAIFFDRKRYQLIDSWGDNAVEQLSSCSDPSAIVDVIVDRPIDKSAKALQHSKKQLSFFISYAQESPAHADFIEMVLRRRNYTVYRDESDIAPSEDIPNAIKEHICKSDIFIAVWCKEYACSPWCFDELSMALETHKKEGKSLWIFRTDKTRMVPPKARSILFYDVDTREDIERRILSLLNNITEA